jgi:hypothetical protein
VEQVWVLTRRGEVMAVYASKTDADEAMWLAVGQDTRELNVLTIAGEYDLRRFDVLGSAAHEGTDLADW